MSHFLLCEYVCVKHVCSCRKLRSSCVLSLEVDYSRHLITSGNDKSASNSMDPPDSSASNAPPTTTSSVGYKLKARLRESSTMDRNPLNMSSSNLRREPFTSATARKVSQSTSASSLASSRIGGVDDVCTSYVLFHTLRVIILPCMYKRII